MTRSFMCILAVVVLSICLLSGGCSSDNPNLKSLKDLFKPVATQTSQDTNKQQTAVNPSPTPSSTVANIDVKLYFIASGTGKLAEEDRKVEKTTGMARKVIEELIKGPAVQQHSAVFPAGTRLQDINIRSTDQICVVDFSTEVKQVNSAEQEKMLVYAVVNTLGQFPNVKGVSFMIDGKKVNTLAGHIDLSQPLKPNYKI
ncbi:MAG TPA: GerMN domain-containing protein [Syntrophomonadaceae bacterium]|nr:GerMN domain-containing protein [Syntrophomonadaceae bacterium]